MRITKNKIDYNSLNIKDPNVIGTSLNLRKMNRNEFINNENKVNSFPQHYTEKSNFYISFMKNNGIIDLTNNQLYFELFLFIVYCFFYIILVCFPQNHFKFLSLFSSSYILFLASTGFSIFCFIRDNSMKWYNLVLTLSSCLFFIIIFSL